mgnify:CR=1 FL=1
MIECETQTTRLNEPPEPSPGLSAAMPWVKVEQNGRPERAREPLKKSERVKSRVQYPLNERFSRPFRADENFVLRSQGIAREREALGFNLLAFQASH